MAPKAPPPYQPFWNGKTNQGKIYIILQSIYRRFRFSLNNCEITKFRDFARWSQKLRSDEFGQNFKVLLSKCYEIGVNQIISYQKYQKLIKLIFIFIRNHLRVGNWLNHSQKTTLTNSFFYSHFNYCPLVWVFCSKEANNKIEKLHKRALQIIHDDFTSSYDDL